MKTGSDTPFKLLQSQEKAEYYQASSEDAKIHLLVSYY
jgi:hypothetical protein